jgi:acyl-CoA oxidase
MQTTATFDKATDEFVIHTPTTLAQKYWITNGAVHAKWAGETPQPRYALPHRKAT